MGEDEARAQVLEEARRVLAAEREALEALRQSLSDTFVDVVQLCLGCRGRVIVCGIGKSGIIGQKIASTLASTGTHSMFLHPAEAVHGDLGMVREDDVLVLISHSGETDEIMALLPHLQDLGVPIVAITGNPESTLARHATVCLDLGVRREACPLDLAPTASTTATLALGDALAAALMVRRGFQREDFAQLHPGGALGRRLRMSVSTLMRKGPDNPVVRSNQPLAEAIAEITAKGVGATNVADKKGRLVGILTDGDVRRLVGRGPVDVARPVAEFMVRKPVTVSDGDTAANALVLMENRPRKTTLGDGVGLSVPGRLLVLPVVDAEGRSVGMLHIHDLVRTGMR